MPLSGPAGTKRHGVAISYALHVLLLHGDEGIGHGAQFHRGLRANVASSTHELSLSHFTHKYNPHVFTLCGPRCNCRLFISNKTRAVGEGGRLTGRRAGTEYRLREVGSVRYSSSWFGREGGNRAAFIFWRRGFSILNEPVEPVQKLQIIRSC